VAATGELGGDASPRAPGGASDGDLHVSISCSRFWIIQGVTDGD
jgi:hypothetical protein